MSAELTKLTVEVALNAELETHLGYSSHDKHGYNSGNSRNGSTPKTVKGTYGEFVINMLRDRDMSTVTAIMKEILNTIVKNTAE